MNLVFWLRPGQWQILHDLHVFGAIPAQLTCGQAGATVEDLAELSDDHGLVYGLYPGVHPSTAHRLTKATIHDGDLWAYLTERGHDAERAIRKPRRVLQHLDRHHRIAVDQLRNVTDASWEELIELDRRGLIETRRPDDHRADGAFVATPLYARHAVPARDTLVASITTKGRTYVTAA